MPQRGMTRGLTLRPLRPVRSDWYNTALAFAVITGLACLLGAVFDVFTLRYQHALSAAQQV